MGKQQQQQQQQSGSMMALASVTTAVGTRSRLLLVMLVYSFFLIIWVASRCSDENGDPILSSVEQLATDGEGWNFFVLEKLCQEPLWNRSSGCWDEVNVFKCLRSSLVWLLPFFLLLMGCGDGFVNGGSVDDDGSGGDVAKVTQRRPGNMMSSMLMGLTMAEVSSAYYTDSLGSTDMFFSFLFLATCGKVRRQHSKALQVSFWLLTTVCLLPEAMVATEEMADYWDIMSVGFRLLQFVLSGCLLLTEICSTGILSKLSSVLLFSWLSPVLELKTLDFSQLPTADTGLKNILNAFERCWKKKSASSSSRVNLVTVLAETFASEIVMGAVVKVLADVLYLSQPLIFRLFISEVARDDDGNNWSGYFLAFAMFCATSAHVVAKKQYVHMVNACGLRMRAAASAAVFKKSLGLTKGGKTGKGEMLNYMSSDCQQIANVMQYLNFVWAAPLEIGVAVYFLYQMVGVSAFAGMAVLTLFCVPVNAVSMKWAQLLEAELAEVKDKRMHLLSEALLGIKCIKLYSWESAVSKLLFRIRISEIDCLKKLAVCWSNMNACFSVCPIMVTMATFATYVYLNPIHNVLTADKVFSCMFLFNIIRNPMYILPVCIMDIVKVALSVRRLNEFLNCKEITEVEETETHVGENSIVFQGVDLAWGEEKEDMVLKELSLNVKMGSLTAVVGKVGSGKSSLLASLMGELEVLRGRICRTPGNLAYVPQQAWIQNMSIKSNILFGREYDRERYEAVLAACALLPDLNLLPAGDETEIGENGVNLSGGQKQRVSLARAVYSNADVFLLDDPLSALDTRVVEHVFVHCLQGLLRHKTRVLITHNTSHLANMDRIVLLEAGEVVADGNFQRLSESNVKFDLYVKSEELLQQQQKESLDVNDNVIIRELQTNGGSKFVVEEEVASATAEETGTSYRHYLYLLKKANVSMCLLIASMTLLSNACITYASILLSNWTDKMSVSTIFAMTEFTHFLHTFFLVILVQGVSCYLENYLHFRRSALVSGQMHDRTLKSVFMSPMGFFDANPTGRIVSRFSSDMDVLDQKIPRDVYDAWYCIASMFILLLLTLYLMPTIVLFVAPILMFLAADSQGDFDRSKRQLQQLESSCKSDLFSFFSEATQGVSVIRAFGAKQRFLATNSAKLERHLHCSYLNMTAAQWLAVRTDLTGDALIFLVSLLALCNRGHISTGMIAMLVTFSMEILEYLGYLVTTVSELKSDSVALERLREYEDLPPEEEEEGEKSKFENWPKDGSISFVNYSARYKPHLEDVVKDLNLEIRSGEKVGLCGRTGAGKTSLAMALFRIINPSEGKILISGTNIAKLSLRQLRSQITVIPQDPVLFSGSLRFNLDPEGMYRDEEILTALGHAHMGDMELEQSVGEGGGNFSVGQKQLLCLARALLRKSKILVMDEATSAMDAATEAVVREMVETRFAESTVLTIAHRMGTLRGSVDRVVVMDKGEMVECGTPGELLKNQKSHFYAMCTNAGVF